MDDYPFNKGKNMKRFTSIVLLIVFSILSISTVSAINLEDVGPHAMARYIPREARAFVGVNIGESLFERIDHVIANVVSKLPAEMEIPPTTLDDLLTDAMGNSDVQWEDLRAVLGDYVGAGVTSVDAFDNVQGEFAWVLVEITDQNGVEDLLQTVGGDQLSNRTVEGDTIVYKMSSNDDNVRLMITPTMMIITNDPDYTTNLDGSLASKNEFKATVSNLTFDHYDLLVYASADLMSQAFRSGDLEPLDAMGMSLDDFGGMAFGVSIVNDTTLAMDFAIETGTPMSVPPVSNDFLRMFPESTDVMLAATDFTNLFNNIISINEALDGNSRNNPLRDIEIGLRVAGLDLQDDILNWTTGNYGMFFGADLVSIMQSMMLGGAPEQLDIDAGILVEATDPEAARNVVVNLTETMDLLLKEEQDVVVTVDGDITYITAEVPMGEDTTTLDLVLTSNDDYFFFGTESAYEKMLAGQTMANDADFANATQYFLDNPSGVFYGGSDSVAMVASVPLLFMNTINQSAFSAVGGGVSEVVDGSMDMMMDGPDSMGAFLSAIESIFSSVSVTTSVDDAGVMKFRFVLALNA